MALEEIPIVEIDITRQGFLKFVVVELDNGLTKKSVLRSGPASMCYHKDIFNALREQLQGEGIWSTCLGGGMVVVDPQDNTMVLRSKSLEYGKEPNREETVKMIQAVHSNFHVSFEI